MKISRMILLLSSHRLRDCSQTMSLAWSMLHKNAQNLSPSLILSSITLELVHFHPLFPTHLNQPVCFCSLLNDQPLLSLIEQSFIYLLKALYLSLHLACY